MGFFIAENNAELMGEPLARLVEVPTLGEHDKVYDSSLGVTYVTTETVLASIEGQLSTAIQI